MIRITPTARAATLGALVLVTTTLAAQAQETGATPVGDALKALQADTWATRSYSFADIGLTKPETLASLDASRLVYLPVPSGLDIKDAEVALETRYFRAQDRRTTFVVSVDGYPVAARAPLSDKGALDLTIGVDAAPRPSGFVELGRPDLAVPVPLRHRRHHRSPDRLERASLPARDPGVGRDDAG